MYTSNCSICGLEFTHKFPSQKVCNACKIHKCEVCGKEFKREHPYDQKYCSQKCRNIAKSDPEKNKEWTAKRIETLQQKYGVDNISKLGSIKSKISQSKINPLAYNQRKAEEIAEEKANRTPLIRKCVICGKEFEATGSQTTCPGPHYRTCKVCGKQFEFKHISDKKETCSKECENELRRDTNKKVLRTCKYCGKEFFSIFSRVHYCPGLHYATCEVCGKQFEIDLNKVDVDHIPKTCSKECKQSLMSRTCLEKYGVPFASQTAENRQKARISSIKNTDQRQQTCLERYGFDNVAKVPEIANKISQTVASEENQEKMKATTRERYGVDYAMQSPEIAKKHSGNQFRTHADDGTRVDSSWEKLFYDFLKSNNIDFQYNEITFPFKDSEGKDHVTYIDFKVGDRLFEVKGSHLLEGYYSDENPNFIKEKVNIYRENKVTIITDSECKYMFDKYDPRYIGLQGVSVDVFNPELNTNGGNFTWKNLLRCIDDGLDYCWVGDLYELPEPFKSFIYNPDDLLINARKLSREFCIKFQGSSAVTYEDILNMLIGRLETKYFYKFHEDFFAKDIAYIMMETKWNLEGEYRSVQDWARATGRV